MINFRMVWLFFLSYIFRKKEFKIGSVFTADTMSKLPPISDETLVKIKESERQLEEPQTLYFMSKKKGIVYKYAYSHTSPNGVFLHALQSKKSGPNYELHVSSQLLIRNFLQITTDENIECH